MKTLLVGLLGVLLLAGRSPAEEIDSDYARRIDQVIEQAIGRAQIPGAVVLVGKGDQVLYRKAYGHRAIDPEKSPMTVDTVFDLASLSKPVGCATSIMILAERGKIRLDEKVSAYIPEFGNNGKESITVAQLLLHRGGLIPDNPIKDYEGTPAESIAKVFALKPEKEVGKQFWYTDVGYIVLGELVQRVDGRRLDVFAREEIFQKLGMKDTSYLPSGQLKARSAPTEKRDGRWMAGEVHDPRAYALGGVAGHAGLFGTANDLAIYCRMILSAGEVDGKRILSAATLRQMIEPRCLDDESGCRTYGFDVDTGYSPSPRGDRFQPKKTFGHTGFTGTMFWMDPSSKTYVILLANRVHPDGKGEVGALRRRVATLAAEAVLGPGDLPAGKSVADALNAKEIASVGRPAQVLCGIDVLKADGFKALDGRRVALITNHTGRDRDGNRTIDILAAQQNFKLVHLFSPEHGIAGLLDEKVGHGVDEKTGLKVYSLYGATRQPTAEMLEGIDTLVFDIQDIGARFYTYVATMGNSMREAAKHKMRFVVLDRPNPISGLHVDGPIADKKHFSFIAFGPLPVMHGMTVGELARLFNKEYEINCDLHVVEVEGWRRAMWFDETGLMWTNPSPNMRNLTQALVYPGICLMEATNVSMGRGTDQPWEMFGAPWIDGKKLAAALNTARLPGLRFVPVEFTPKASKHVNMRCEGVYVIVTDRNAVEPVRAGLTIAWTVKKLFGEQFEFDKVERLLSNEAVTKALGQAKKPDEVMTLWRDDLENFRKTREKYLLYR